MTGDVVLECNGAYQAFDIQELVLLRRCDLYYPNAKYQPVILTREQAIDAIEQSKRNGWFVESCTEAGKQLLVSLPEK